jgi:hypothetical protein
MEKILRNEYNGTESCMVTILERMKQMKLDHRYLGDTIGIHCVAGGV